MKKYLTKKSISERSREAIGLSIGQIDTTGRLSTGKGSIGTVIEESWFGIKPNNKSEPDFIEAGVELKVTPVKKTKEKYTSKERLVLNIINYIKESKQSFYSSSFWNKNKCLELIFYEHIDNVDKYNFKIVEELLFEYPEQDLLIIKNDWETIVKMIRNGQAHELSEGLTQYLGACTKGSTSKSSLREQPLTNIKAKQRAYSLKQSYMSYVFNNYALNNKKDECIIRNTRNIVESSFEDYIYAKIASYIGKSQKTLLKEFCLTKSKGVNEIIISRILGIKGKISNTEEFKKAGILVKTIRVEYNNTIEQSMSFPAFKFKELIKEEWETSELKEMLETTRFLFVVFKFNENKELILKGIKFWNMPLIDIESEVKKVWEQTVAIIKNGVKLEKRGNRIYNNLPKLKGNRVVHVRPHTSKSSYEPNTPFSDELPNGMWMTKQCFWLNSSYIVEQISDFL